jgi:predicted CoA-substrate-specific enzyme activase
MSRPAAIGIDIGSTTCKAVVVDAQGEILASRVEPTDPRIEQQAGRVLALLREATSAPADLPIGATGYGRKRVTASRKVTEITCHARGAWHATRTAGVLIDMGGQDTKVIHIGEGGGVRDFAMNDKCAAGTGRFLEVILGRLRVPYDEVEAEVSRASRPVSISSTCTVFAESEVVSLVAQGEPIEGILKGLHVSLASRVTSLAGRMIGGEPVFMSGGVALNAAMVKILSAAIGRPILVIREPQIVGAVGAALAAL